MLKGLSLLHKIMILVRLYEKNKLNLTILMNIKIVRRSTPYVTSVRMLQFNLGDYNFILFGDKTMQIKKS